MSPDARRSPARRRPLALGIALVPALALLVGETHARDDRWYLGVGGGAAFLRPDAAAPGLDADEDPASAATLYGGRDLDERSSVQLQLHALGEGSFENGETVDYLAGEASVLYRFHDSRDRAPRGTVLGASVYGRFGLGFIARDGDVTLENDLGAYFGAGAGLELHLTRNLALRAEGVYHERDAVSAALSLAVRLGDDGRRPAPVPAAGPNAPEDPPLPSDSAAPQSDPAAVANVAGERRRDPAADGDGDGVPDAADTCPDSAHGFPVRGNGCALLDGVLSGLRFESGTAELGPGALEQLDHLAELLERYPLARVELRAHTDDAGGVREQSILTRERLRTIGTYLVQRRGIRSNRLVLRSFGGARPLYDNLTDANRRLNNRIEILEKTG